MYNTFCQDRHHPEAFDVVGAADGAYHTYTTEWRTKLRPLPGVTDAQVVERDGYWWVSDKAVAYESYLGNPLKRLGKDNYAVYAGARADHWIDGRPVARNTRFVPSMAAQLNLGVWLPDWAGAAPWKTARISFASIKVWQYGDEGGVRGILVDDIVDSAGTLCNAAEALMERGAKSVSAYVSHGVLSGGAVGRVTASPLAVLRV